MLKNRLQEDMKTAMRAQDKSRLSIIRLMLAAIKQIEVDQRIEVSNQIIMPLLEKMIKQRRESIDHFEKAQRQELVNQEKYEIEIIQQYLPPALPEHEIDQLIASAINQTGAKLPQDMGKLMALLKPQLSGRADMSIVSQKIKQHLA